MVNHPVFSAPPNFTDHVAPIVRNKCLNCHNPDKARGGLDLSSYGKTMEGGSSGAVVKPGDADGSRLWTLTAHKEEPKMPPNAAMIAAESVDTLKKWIEGGALETAGSKAAPPSKPKVNLSAVVSKGRPEGPPPMPGAKLPSEPVVRTARANAAMAIAASPWASVVAVAAPKQVLLYGTDAGDLLGVLPFPEGQPHSLKFSRSGKLLLAAGGRGGQSGKAVLFNVETGARVIEIGDERDAILAADLSPDQTLVAVGGPSKRVRVYSAEDGTLVRDIKKHTDWVTAVEFSPDGHLLATGDRAGGLLVWEATTGREQFALRGHTNMVTDVSWRDDAGLLASGSEDGTVRLWELQDGKQVKTWSLGGILGVKYGHDGKIATVGRDKVARLYSGDGTLIKAFPQMADVGLQVAVTHDGGRVIAGDWTGTVTVFSAADGKPSATLTTNPAPFAERLAVAEKAAGEREAAHKAALAAVTKAEQAAAEAKAALAKAEQRARDAAQAAADAPRKVAEARTAVQQAQQAAAEATRKHTAAEAKAKAAAEKLVANPPADVEKRKAAKEEAAKLAATAAELRTAAATAEAAVKPARDKADAAVKAVPELAQAAKQAPKDVPDWQKAAQAADEAVAKAKAAAEQAARDAEAAKQTLARMRGRSVATK